MVIDIHWVLYDCLMDEVFELRCFLIDDLINESEQIRKLRLNLSGS